MGDQACFEKHVSTKLQCSSLVVWRLDELGRINQTTSGPERKAALCDLLEHESQLIASIGKHKIEAGKEHKSMAVQRFLDAVSPTTTSVE